MAVDARVGRLAARQHGVVSHRQLVELGLSKAAISHRVATGRLHRLHRGAYLVGTPAPPPLALETAALFAFAPCAVLSHQTAARLLGLTDRREPELDVTVVGRYCRGRNGIRIHRTRTMPSHDIRRHERLPITAPVRTILDIAGSWDARELERALHEAQVQRLLTVSQLKRRLESERGRRGVSTLRRLVGSQREPRITRSEAERLFLELVRAAGLPEPRTDHAIGPYRVDFAWPEHRLVAELDSVAFHATQPRFVRDRRRWADLDALGWRVFRFTWWDVVDEPHALLVRLTRSLMRDGP